MTRPGDTATDLISEGQALVYSLASKIARSVPVRIDLDDLIAYGQVGLAEAAREFDPERGVQFTTFAYYRIRGAIYDGISKMSWTSRAQYARHRYEQMANETLRQAHESTPGSDPASSEDEARWFRNVSEKLAIVHLVSGPKERGGGIRESSIEDPAASPAVTAVGRELQQKLHDMVDQLPPAEQRLIRTVYFEGATVQEAADRIGVSKSWASRMHAKILEQLSRSLRRMGAD